MVSDSQNKTSKPTIEILPDPESKTSSLALIEDIHDRSKNENDTPSKTSMKNVLYEPGTIDYVQIQLCSVPVSCMYVRCTLTQTNMHTHKYTPHTPTSWTIATEPKITDFQPEVYANEGEQVTLHINFTGTPKPTITWTFKGTKMEGDYATELGTDGSLLFVCVETKYAGKYNTEL